jgi:AraC-like DNA-binding protein
MSNGKFSFFVPYVRWANIQTFHNNSTSYRKIYDHELIYVLDGFGEILLDKVAYEAKPNRLFLIQPRVWHSYRPVRDVTMRLLGVHFDWTPQSDGLEFPDSSPGIRPVDEAKFRDAIGIEGWELAAEPFLDLVEHLQVRHALEAVVTEYRPRDEEAQSIAGALLVVAILQIQRAVRLMQRTQQGTLLGPDTLRRAAKAHALLSAAPEAPCPVEEVARQIGWSGNHLRRVFRQAYGVSPHQFRMNSRLQQARQLLRHEAISIAQVGLHCGFADAAHFTRVFKADSGLTPRQFRRQIKRI